MRRNLSVCRCAFAGTALVVYSPLGQRSSEEPLRQLARRVRQSSDRLVERI